MKDEKITCPKCSSTNCVSVFENNVCFNCGKKWKNEELLSTSIQSDALDSEITKCIITVGIFGGLISLTCIILTALGFL